ncbi:MAG: acetoacetate--CoA ligase [Pseudomonadales bacterium]
MPEPLWIPSIDRINTSNMQRFLRQLEHETKLSFENYAQLHQWSVENPESFWEQVWKFGGIITSSPYDRILDGEGQFENASWFPGARLNFAENLLRRQDDGLALIARMENGSRQTITHKELYQHVAQLTAAMRASGVESGDRVAGFMPNVPETLIAMLAATSIGAVWSSCSPDFGLNGVMDRFGQIQPKVLFACDGYFYNGKTIDCTSRVIDIVAGIPSLLQLVVVPVIGKGLEGELNQLSTLFEDYLVKKNTPPLQFEQLPFNHPLYIMYSSGTTGVPKCIVHSAGGTLIQHIKEHQLHVGIQKDDVFFYYTTCGWMMWNWLVSGLASGATLMLYDGSPFSPSPIALLDMLEQERISVFGCSAKYITAIDKQNLKPSTSHDVSSLKTLLSTGSPLSHESFRYVYREIKKDICLSSISGGTDILSGFAVGNECLPVWEGEIQCLALGMAVQFWDDSGNEVIGEKGELVCTQPFPCTPIGFWNDPDGAKYHAAYFDKYPGMWAHGDFGEITPRGGVLIHGRSDALLNPGGVRIGTAEIYRQVEKLDAIVDSVCIGQEWMDDTRVVLFVILKENVDLTEKLVDKIRQTIRRETTPRHVPSKIIAVTDIPRTLSGKIVELAVRDVVHNKPIKNTDALANPEALELFRNIPELAVKHSIRKDA